MYLIATRYGSTRRHEIPAAIERDGGAEAYVAKLSKAEWDAAEAVGPQWPHTTPVVPAVVAPATPEPLSLPDED